MAGSGAASLGLVKRQPSTAQKVVLLVAALALILIGALFLIPLVSQAVSAPFWFFFKVALFVYAMIWFRGTFPRFRYDQLMDIGWKRMIPIGMAAILINAVVGMLKG